MVYSTVLGETSTHNKRTFLSCVLTMQKQETSEDGMWPTAPSQQHMNTWRERRPELRSPSSFLPSRAHLVERREKTRAAMLLSLLLELNSLAQD